MNVEYNKIMSNILETTANIIDLSGLNSDPFDDGQFFSPSPGHSIAQRQYNEDFLLFDSRWKQQAALQTCSFRFEHPRL